MLLTASDRQGVSTTGGTPTSATRRHCHQSGRSAPGREAADAWHAADLRPCRRVQLTQRVPTDRPTAPQLSQLTQAMHAACAHPVNELGNAHGLCASLVSCVASCSQRRRVLLPLPDVCCMWHAYEPGLSTSQYHRIGCVAHVACCSAPCSRCAAATSQRPSQGAINSMTLLSDVVGSPTGRTAAGTSMRDSHTRSSHSTWRWSDTQRSRSPAAPWIPRHVVGKQARVVGRPYRVQSQPEADACALVALERHLAEVGAAAAAAALPRAVPHDTWS